MKISIDKKIKKSFTAQQDHSDCGVACLLSLIRFYGGEGDLEHLRELSGTNNEGTTLLGLEQAANEVGFDAEGCNASISSLIAHNKPAILHVIINENLHHYIVCYGYIDDCFVIGDPSDGIRRISSKELDKIWVTKNCLTLVPNNRFESKKDKTNYKRKWIKSLIKEDIQILVTSIALGIGIAVLGLSMAVFQKKLVDNILPTKNTEALFVGLIALAFLLILKSGLSALRSILLIDQSRHFNIRITKAFLNRLLILPKPFFDTRKVGDFVARLNDTSRIQRVISQLIGNAIIDAIIGLVTIVFLFFFSWKIAAVAMVGLGLYIIILYKHNDEIILAQKSVMGNYASNESQYIDTITGITDIKSYNRHHDFLEKNLSVFSRFQESIFNLGKINIKISFTAGVVSMIILLSILSIGSILVLNEEMKLGGLIAVLGVSVTLISSVTNLAMISIPINEARVAFDRMYNFSLNDKPRVRETLKLPQIQSILLDDLSFSFKGRAPLLSNITLVLNKGNITTLLGESGSGKSTLLQIIHKFYTPASGKIKINATYDISSIAQPLWNNQISYIPQNVHLFNGSVLSNITLSENKDEWKKAVDLCHELGLSKIISSFPQGFMTIIGDGGVNLSGGQRQILALARALYFNPKILLLDEATSAMDRNTENFVLDLLQELKKEMIIFIVSHQIKIASRSDYIYILENQKISAQGTPDALLLGKNFYSEGVSDLLCTN